MHVQMLRGAVIACVQCSRLPRGLNSTLRVLKRSIRRQATQEPESLITPSIRQHLKTLVERHCSLVTRLSSETSGNIIQDEQSRLFKEVSTLEVIVKLVNQLDEKHQEMKEYDVMIRDEKELAELACADRERCANDIKLIELALINALVPGDEADEASAILEVKSGAGGREASLFTAEMFTMYSRFSDYKEWKFETLSCDRSDDGGYKSASASINGPGVYKLLKFEGGVHRVQRVPATEALGRVHTSTMSVAILPDPSEVDIRVNSNDLKIETFRAGGAGGQHVNTTDSAVRITHLPSGINVKIQDERSQHRNKDKALKILRARLYEVKRNKEAIQRQKERKQQTGTGERHERIRTYNYNQDRVTDHRVGMTVYGVQEFLQGGAKLEAIILELQRHQRANYLTKTFK